MPFFFSFLFFLSLLFQGNSSRYTEFAFFFPFFLSIFIMINYLFYLLATLSIKLSCTCLCFIIVCLNFKQGLGAQLHRIRLISLLCCYIYSRAIVSYAHEFTAPVVVKSQSVKEVVKHFSFPLFILAFTNRVRSSTKQSSSCFSKETSCAVESGRFARASELPFTSAQRLLLNARR